jgi:hypothetical protein
VRRIADVPAELNRIASSHAGGFRREPSDLRARLVNERLATFRFYEMVIAPSRPRRRNHLVVEADQAREPDVREDQLNPRPLEVGSVTPTALLAAEW